RPPAFGPRDGVPKGGVGPMGPVADGANAGVERRGLELAEGQNRLADAFENSHKIIDMPQEQLALPRTRAEERPGISRRLGASLNEDGDQSMTRQRISAQPVVCPHVGLPEVLKARRIGPEAERVVWIVFENDMSTRTNGAHHLPHNG